MKLTLRGYQAFAEAQLEAQEREEVLDDLSILTSFLTLSKREIDIMPNKLIDDALEAISGLLNKTEYNFVPTFKHKGVLYGFIPNLDTITYGENTDLVRYVSDWDTIDSLNFFLG